MPCKALHRCLVALLLAPTLLAQTPSPNADILKMIQAGLPEAVIVDKIIAGSGHWDVSVDALIALKQAGATPAEMKAMTAPLATPAPQIAAAPEAPTVVAGGVLQRTKQGDIYLKFPEPRTTIFPNGEPSNLAWLISFEGKPAVRVPGERVDGDNTSGNLIITNERVIFDPYLVENGWAFYPKHGKYVLSPKAWQEMTRDATLNMARSDVKLNYINMEHGVNSVQGSYPSTRATIFSKGTKAYNIGFHFVGTGSFPQEPDNLCAKSEDCLSPQLEAFVRNLIRDFDGTIAPFMAAAGITDVDKQLTAVSHYHLTTQADLPKWAAIYQAQIDQLPPPTKTGGGFLSGLGEGLQIAAAGATALQQSSAGGNTVTAQNNAMAQYNQNVAAIESGGTPNLTPAPVATTPASAPAKASATAPSGKTYTKTYSSQLPDGDMRKETIVSGPSGATITVECFAPRATLPYQSYTRSGPSEFFQNLPFCSRQATTTTQGGGGSTNTVAPPVAYQPPPSTGGTIVAATCPASGFVPGLMIQNGDTAVGVPCTPGQPIKSSSSSTSAPTSTTATSGMKTAPPLTKCVAQSYVNDDLTVTNTCNAPVYVTWWINGHSGSWTINPGDHTGTGYNSADVAAGSATFYACPQNYSPVDSAGNVLTSGIGNYNCRQF